VPRLFLEQYIQEKYDPALMREIVRLVEDTVNGLAEGRIYRSYNAATAAPSGTTVSYQVADFIRNSNPTELGTAGSKYIILGFICIAAGTPGTWREARVLTGN
jgi:hypothetical protein